MEINIPINNITEELKEAVNIYNKCKNSIGKIYKLYNLSLWNITYIFGSIRIFLENKSNES